MLCLFFFFFFINIHVNFFFHSFSRFPVLDGLEMDVGLNLTKTSVDQMIATFQRELGKSVPIEAGLPTLAPLHITLSPVCYFAFVLDVGMCYMILF